MIDVQRLLESSQPAAHNRGQRRHSGPRSPVEGGRVALGLAAEHHLFAVLATLEGKHHAAGLLGEHGPQLDSAS